MRGYTGFNFEESVVYLISPQSQKRLMPQVQATVCSKVYYTLYCRLVYKRCQKHGKGVVLVKVHRENRSDGSPKFDMSPITTHHFRGHG